VTHAVFLAGAGGDKAVAEAYARKALDIDNDDARSWLTLALLLESLPKPNFRSGRGIPQSRRARPKGRTLFGAAYCLAEFLVHRGEETAAQEAMTAWFGGEMPCYCCAVLEGDIAARSGNSVNASRAYRGALELRKDGIQALTGLSRCVNARKAKN